MYHLRRFLGYVAFLTLIVQAPADENTWGIGPSVWFPDDGDTGVGVSAKLSFNLIEQAYIDFRAAWFDDLGDDDGASALELEVIPLEAGISGMWLVGSRTELYAGGGGGFYLVDAVLTEFGGQGVDLDDEVGGYLVTGLEYTIARDAELDGATRVTLYVEAMYRFLELDALTSADDLTISGLALTGGLTLRW